MLYVELNSADAIPEGVGSLKALERLRIGPNRRIRGSTSILN